jgi:hypothetical protein
MASRLLKAARLLAVGTVATSSIVISLTDTASASTRPRAVKFSGFGFDTCTAPTVADMRAWTASPFRAINIYIGGGNRACRQPNLKASWVRTVTEMGWRLIPTYVSLQAPRTSCRCTRMDPRRANAEGVAAANNAAKAAAALGIGRGNPIYDDMEAYAVDARDTRAVLLQGWTGRLHRDGYVSGVYSSASSGISDLVSTVGRSFAEPNDIWIGDWNGRATTDDGVVPGRDWRHDQRIHQYRGPHTDRFGGVRISIDTDYCRAAVVAG